MRLGWSTPDFGACEIIYRPNRDSRARLLNHDKDKTVHIFSGIHAKPMIQKVPSGGPGGSRPGVGSIDVRSFCCRGMVGLPK